MNECMNNATAPALAPAYTYADIPVELWNMVLDYLSLRQVMQLRLVCQRFAYDLSVMPDTTNHAQTKRQHKALDNSRVLRALLCRARIEACMRDRQNEWQTFVGSVSCELSVLMNLAYSTHIDIVLYGRAHVKRKHLRAYDSSVYAYNILHDNLVVVAALLSLRRLADAAAGASASSEEGASSEEDASDEEGAGDDLYDVWEMAVFCDAISVLRYIHSIFTIPIDTAIKTLHDMCAAHQYTGNHQVSCAGRVFVQPATIETLGLQDKSMTENARCQKMYSHRVVGYILDHANETVWRNALRVFVPFFDQMHPIPLMLVLRTIHAQKIPNKAVQPVGMSADEDEYSLLTSRECLYTMSYVRSLISHRKHRLGIIFCHISAIEHLLRCGMYDCARAAAHQAPWLWIIIRHANHQHYVRYSSYDEDCVPFMLFLWEHMFIYGYREITSGRRPWSPRDIRRAESIYGFGLQESSAQRVAIEYVLGYGADAQKQEYGPNLKFTNREDYLSYCLVVHARNFMQYGMRVGNADVIRCVLTSLSSVGVYLNTVVYHSDILKSSKISDNKLVEFFRALENLQPPCRFVFDNIFDALAMYMCNRYCATVTYLCCFYQCWNELKRAIEYYASTTHTNAADLQAYKDLLASKSPANT